ncbi:MAG: response regulator [Desulfobacteraceae bacterium]|jgi:DNA-binding NtrC family response regulator|nr:MAG: response regulator [Desulfobacteraceae bacterium]
MDTKKAEKIIKGKRVLIVDDEKDVVETLVELLSVCKLDRAFSFEEAKQQLQENDYDVVILDIMGVRGFDLLEIARKRKIPALMLTAHALTEESLNKSVKEGAAYFAPKDQIENIAVFLADVIESIQKDKNPWIRLLERLGGFYDNRFLGTDWRKKELEYLLKKGKGYL